MASRLQSLIQEIQASVDAARAAVAPPLPAVEWLYGYRHLPKNSGFPRVVWYRTRDDSKPAIQTDDDTVSVLTKVSGVIAAIFDEDDEKTELLEDQIIVAAYEYASPDFMFDGAQWDQPEWLTKGEHVAVAFTFNQPVTTDVLHATVTAVEPVPSTSTSGDGVLECGES